MVLYQYTINTTRSHATVGICRVHCVVQCPSSALQPVMLPEPFSEAPILIAPNRVPSHKSLITQICMITLILHVLFGVHRTQATVRCSACASAPRVILLIITVSPQEDTARTLKAQ